MGLANTRTLPARVGKSVLCRAAQGWTGQVRVPVCCPRRSFCFGCPPSQRRAAACAASAWGSVHLSAPLSVHPCSARSADCSPSPGNYQRQMPAAIHASMTRSGAPAARRFHRSCTPRRTPRRPRAIRSRPEGGRYSRARTRPSVSPCLASRSNRTTTSLVPPAPPTQAQAQQHPLPQALAEPDVSRTRRLDGAGRRNAQQLAARAGMEDGAQDALEHDPCRR